jgi:hypothetical protein
MKKIYLTTLTLPKILLYFILGLWIGSISLVLWTLITST